MKYARGGAELDENIICLHMATLWYRSTKMRCNAQCASHMPEHVVVYKNSHMFICEPLFPRKAELPIRIEPRDRAYLALAEAPATDRQLSDVFIAHSRVAQHPARNTKEQTSV